MLMSTLFLEGHTNAWTLLKTTVVFSVLSVGGAMYVYIYRHIHDHDSRLSALVGEDPFDGKRLGC